MHVCEYSRKFEKSNVGMPITMWAPQGLRNEENLRTSTHSPTWTLWSFQKVGFSSMSNCCSTIDFPAPPPPPLALLLTLTALEGVAPYLRDLVTLRFGVVDDVVEVLELLGGLFGLRILDPASPESLRGGLPPWDGILEGFLGVSVLLAPV